MKKIFTITASILVLTNFTIAQSFTLVPKVGKAEGSSVKNMIDIGVQFTNISSDRSDSIFNYEVIEVSIPSTWTLQNCDPFKCLEGSGVVGFKSSFILPNTLGSNSGYFKMDFLPNGTSGSGTTKLVITSAKTFYADTLTAEAKVWSVSIKENILKENSVFSIYPNPTKDKLLVKYLSKEFVQVEIYNNVGSKVKTFDIDGGEATVNIEELSNGIYFLRFIDNGKIVYKSFTKN
jgi:hypothetical protein